LTLAVAGCGSAAKTSSTTSRTATTTTSSAATPGTTPTSTVPTAPPAVDQLAAAERPHAAEFPPAHGRSLEQLAKLVRETASLGAANGVFTPGRQRFAFALTAKSGGYIYAPTAIYLAKSPTSPSLGPFLAPADPTGVPPPYRSEQNSGPGGLKAVYWTKLPLPRSGIFDVLALSRVGNVVIGSTGELAVALSTPIPAPGQHPPAIATDTLATTHGNVALLTTRVPPENMHSVSFNQVLGKRPVALLFSTPQLCTSRVCGPVTDIMVKLQQQFGSRITFIHQEIYVDNDPSKGLREQLHAFHLETEPWLFVINRKGVITARLEGGFGVNEARLALESGLRG
jgi:hypothetical protein